MNNQELRIEILLEEVVKKRASDLHIQVGLPPMLRIDGSLMPAARTQPLDEPAVERLVFQILDEDQRQILLKDKEFDFSFAFGTLGRFRVNTFHERHPEAEQGQDCRRDCGQQNLIVHLPFPPLTAAHPCGVLRSEERRVGKECRSRWSPYH